MLEKVKDVILRKTKIVATIGPASESPEVLRKLMKAGINVARLNFSHGSHESHRQVIENIRAISNELGRHIAILGDLCGPKIRVGTFENGEILLNKGEEVLITTEKREGTQGIIPSQYAYLIQDIALGQIILLDDGKLELVVTSINSATTATCRVVCGGILKNKKGMNLPGRPLSVPALTNKDYEDLVFCLEQDIDFVAISFVRKAQEIIHLQEKISSLSTSEVKTKVIAKIEKPEALSEIAQIIDEADGIMIARGDLGVELPAHKVPIIQNQLIKLANRHNKPVIVATQMLESMIEQARPTRAEVSDVATAVMEKVDAVMLSGESASGKYPIESVKVMDSTLREVEGYMWAQGGFGRLQTDISVYPLPNALARACTLLSQDMDIRALNVLTRGGKTTGIISSARPNAPVIVYCRRSKVIRQMLLFWGIYPISVEGELDLHNFATLVDKTVKGKKLAEDGDYVLLVSNILGGSDNKHGNSIIIHRVGDQ